MDFPTLESETGPQSSYSLSARSRPHVTSSISLSFCIETMHRHQLPLPVPVSVPSFWSPKMDVRDHAASLHLILESGLVFVAPEVGTRHSHIHSHSRTLNGWLVLPLRVWVCAEGSYEEGLDLKQMRGIYCQHRPIPKNCEGQICHIVSTAKGFISLRVG